ncbi:hypothetical protein CHCC14431_3960 [Bacillus licheniformis]|nr:hypothetical protein CHCC14431_3960 [Bacillus licheniformis]
MKVIELISRNNIKHPAYAGCSAFWQLSYKETAAFILNTADFYDQQAGLRAGCMRVTPVQFWK